MRATVLSLGGSLLYTRATLDSAKIKKLASALKQKKLAIVVGGGVAARKAADNARVKGKSEYDADAAAIRATHANARAVARAIRGSYCNSIESAACAFNRRRTPVMGGLVPGLTTDAVSVLLAEKIGAKRVVNASNVNAVYASDPRKNPRAKRFTRLTHTQLVALAAAQDARRAGQHFVFDLLACKLAARSKIRLEFVDGRDERALAKVLKGGKGGTSAY